MTCAPRRPRGSFLSNFTFGHVRQLDAVASRTVIGLAETVPGLLAGGDRLAMLDIDDTVKAVFGAGKQGAQHGYTRVRGLNAQLATVSAERAAPVILGAPSSPANREPFEGPNEEGPGAARTVPAHWPA